MNKREITIAAVEHRETPVLPHQLNLTSRPKAKLEKYLGTDIEAVADNFLVHSNNGDIRMIEDNTAYVDYFGVEWKLDENGDIGLPRKYWFGEDNFDNGYVFPEPNEELIKTACRDMLENKPDLFHIYDFGFSLFERAWTLRGMENLLMDFVTNEKFVNELMDRILEYNLGVIDIAAKQGIDCFQFGDDWGQQRGLIMGYPSWKKYIYPRLKKMYAKVKEHGLIVSQHSCGDIHEVFGDLIDIGLDIYNTFQPEIYNMAEFKRNYGKYLTIYGGISSQGVFATGTPEEVYDTTIRTMELMGKDGGYIVAPTHSLMDDASTANILAFLDAVHNRPYKKLDI